MRPRIADSVVPSETVIVDRSVLTTSTDGAAATGVLATGLVAVGKRTWAAADAHIRMTPAKAGTTNRNFIIVRPLQSEAWWHNQSVHAQSEFRLTYLLEFPLPAPRY